MLKRLLLAILIVLMSQNGFAQKDINTYKYILVPRQFEFSKSNDEYQLNSLTKFLFNKYGYKCYFTDEVLPEDLNTNRCLALMVDVSNDKSGIFKTKLEISLKDCYDNEIIVSKVGESRLKKYDRAYNEAFRDAFETFRAIEYDYAPNAEVKVEIDGDDENEVSQEKVVKVDKEQPSVKIEKEKGAEIKKVSKHKENIKLLYAQAINDGFQLVDSEPKIIMILINTSAKNVYMVKDKSAIVYKEKNQWIYYENKDGEITKYSMNLKF